MSRMIAFLSLFLLSACAAGEYRIPYSNGVEINVNRDFTNHASPVTRSFDLAAKNPPVFIRAAASGWVRFIEDDFSETGPGKKNNFVWIEHPYPYCPVDSAKANWPGKPANYEQTCKPCNKAFCNEWTFYYHMSRNSVTGITENSAGLEVGDWIEAGELLGVEDDVGFADGKHLHWHVAVIDPSWIPNPTGDTEGGDYEHEIEPGDRRPELIPIVCHADGKTVLWRFADYEAALCLTGNL